MRHNGHVYEMFGNSKHYSVQPPLLYKPAEMTNKPLTAKYFIYDVCALHEQQCTLVYVSFQIGKIQILLVKRNLPCVHYYPEGASPLCARVTP